MIGNIEIFSPADDDHRKLAAVHVAVWRMSYVGIFPDDHLVSLSVDRQHERHRQLANQLGVRYFAARDCSSGGIVGFANGGPSRDADAQAFAGELYAMYLLESHQRRGIGRALLRRLAEQLAADGFRSCSAWVLADNPCRAFYERLGGQPNDSHRRKSACGNSIFLGGHPVPAKRRMMVWRYGSQRPSGNRIPLARHLRSQLQK